MPEDETPGQALNELPIPAGVLDDPHAAEVLRAWIAHQGLHVALIPALEKPEHWGMMLVDIARHAARMFANEGMCGEAEALARMRAFLDAEWESPTDEGTTRTERQQ